LAYDPDSTTCFCRKDRLAIPYLPEEADVMRPSILPTIAVLSSLLACGGDDDNATEPPPGQQTLGSITTTPSGTISLSAGNTRSISVVALDTENRVISNPGTVSFTSSNNTVAEVDGGGEVLAIAAGSADITASLTRGGITKQATLTVQVTGSLPASATVIASTGGDFSFTPRNVAIQAGGSVSWTFGSLEHTVTFTAQAGAPQSILSGLNATISRTFTTAGDFNYTCTIHAGMTGQVVVR
jgi:plastocyanin